MMRRIAALIALSAVVVSCGNKNNFQATDAAEFQIEGDGFISIVMPPDEARTQSQSPLVMRNTGDGVLTISKFEWIDRPDRLVALGERGGSCDSTDQCGADEVCLTSSQTCVSTALPSTPFELAPQLRQDIDFAITQGPTELSCPEPTAADIPPEIAPRYCGSLVIETNATNDFGEIVEDGRAVIYFLDPGASGDIQVEPSFLEFTNVQPGAMMSQSFSITNAGMEDLTVNNMGVEDNPQYFQIGPADGGGLPVTIGSGQAVVIDVNLVVPDTADDYEVFTTLTVESSAGPATVAVEVTAEAGSAPVIQLDESVLGFDAAASQTINIANVGQATLQLNGLTVSPIDSRVFYTFEIDGNDVTNNFQTVNIPRDESIDLVVNFNRPGGNMDPSIGLLEIAHNDRNNGFKSEVTLLGDEGMVPIARISPQSFTFLAADGNSDSRAFVVRNVGTAALDLSAVSWMFSTGSNAEFAITPMSGSVPPGGLFQGTVNFTGMNATPDVGLGILDSNNTSPIELSLRALDSASEQPVPMITVENSGTLRAMSPVNLNATASTPAGVGTNAIWTLIARPASSTMWFDAVGDSASFTPDVAGTYEVALTILQGDREGQTTMDIVVE